MRSLKAGRRLGSACRWQECACAILVAAYFFYFVADTVNVRFAPDDMMNMAYYWRLSSWKLLVSLFMPWRGFYRPLGGLYYLPLHYFFGLNPFPYHIVALFLLLVSLLLTYRLATVLGLGRLTTLLAVLIVSFHAGVANLYYNTAFIYDVLCGLFYLATLIYYVRIREDGRILRGSEIPCFLALYLLALDAKEMAVTLPVIILAYEWIYQAESRPDWRHLAAWIRGPGRGFAMSAILNIPYCYGKAHGRDALMSQLAYAPVVSLDRLKIFQMRSLGELFLAWGQFKIRAVVLLWFAAFYLAWRLNSRILRFCWVYVAVTPLPIEFLEGRGGACLFIPLLGWAIFAAVVFREIVKVLTRALAGDPVLRHLGAHAISTILIATGMFLWAAENRSLKASYIGPSMSALGQPTWDVIRQLRQLNPKVRPNSSIVFLTDPFEGWDMAFIAELWFRDRSLDIRLERKTPSTPDELARANHLFTFVEGRLVQTR